MTRIHQVKGRDLRDALERARDAVGSKAVVLSRRNAASGVTLAVAEAAPRNQTELGLLKGQAQALLAHSPQVQLAPRPRLSTTEIEERLSATGCSKRLIERVSEAVAGRFEEGRHPLDLAGEELGAIFPIRRQRAARGTALVIALLGAPGAGKTTTTAKLALRLTAAGKRVAIVTTDTHRVGSVEQTKAFGRHIGCTAIAMRDPARLAAALADSAPLPDVVLVDTSGRLEEDAEALDRLAAALTAGDVPAQLVRLLLLPASGSREALDHATRATEYDGCVITRLDETRRPARVLERALRAKLPIAFLCDGPSFDGHLHRAAAERFADLLLTGRVA